MKAINQMKFIVISFLLMIQNLNGEDSFDLEHVVIYLCRCFSNRGIDMKEIKQLFEEAVGDLIEDKAICYHERFLFTLNEDLEVMREKYAKIVWDEIEGTFMDVPDINNLMWVEDSTVNTFLLDQQQVCDIAEIILKDGSVDKYIYDSHDTDNFYIGDNIKYEENIKKCFDKYRGNPYAEEINIW
jgi:hypothetical protein